MLHTTAPDESTERRPRRMLTAATGAAVGVTGMLAGAVLPAAPAGATAGAEATTTKAVGAPAREAAAPAVDCSRPTDGRIVRTANLTTITGGDWGDVQLWYSPACRSVQGVAISNQSCGHGVVTTKVWIVRDGTPTASGICPDGGIGKAVTPWVYDGGIQQAAKGAVYVGSSMFANGTTGAY